MLAPAPAAGKVQMLVYGIAFHNTEIEMKCSSSAWPESSLNAAPAPVVGKDHILGYANESLM